MPNQVQHALLLIWTKYMFHFSSLLTSTFAFSFGSAAWQCLSLSYHFAFSCALWVTLVTLNSLPWETLISHIPGHKFFIWTETSLQKPQVWPAGCLSWLAGCHFHSLAVLYWRWWMIPTFCTQRRLDWEKQPGTVKKYSRVVTSAYECRLQFIEKSLQVQWRDRPCSLQFAFSA